MSRSLLFAGAVAVALMAHPARSKEASVTLPSSEVSLGYGSWKARIFGPDRTVAESVLGRELESFPQSGDFVLDPRASPVAGVTVDDSGRQTVDSVVVRLMDGESADALAEAADGADAPMIASKELRICVAFTRKGYESCLEGISASYPVEFDACTSANRHRVAGWSETGELDVSTMEDECRAEINVNHPGSILQSVSFPEEVVLHQKK